MRIRLVKTATGSTPSWMLPVFVVSMQFNYWIFQFIELIELIGLNIFLIQKYILDKLIHKLTILKQK